MPQYLREPRPDSYKLSGVTRVFVTTSRLTGRICLRENESGGRGFLLPQPENKPSPCTFLYYTIYNRIARYER